ncbi:MAG: hypothetical protein ACYS8X_11420 [Planctomycetota bacterium]|jgi:hypothetical protein
MTRDDWIWVAVRVAGVVLIVMAIAAVPDAVGSILSLFTVPSEADSSVFHALFAAIVVAVGTPALFFGTGLYFLGGAPWLAEAIDGSGVWGRSQADHPIVRSVAQGLVEALPEVQEWFRDMQQGGGETVSKVTVREGTVMLQNRDCWPVRVHAVTESADVTLATYFVDAVVGSVVGVSTPDGQMMSLSEWQMQRSFATDAPPDLKESPDQLDPPGSD